MIQNNPFYAQALEFIKNTDLNSLETGKHIINGEDLYVNVIDSSLKTREQARLEAHAKYIDIQIPLSCAETYGVKPISECTMPEGEMDLQKDILFYADPVEKTVTSQPGEMAVFAPDMAHAPLIGEGTIHKAIFKVKVV